MPLALDAVVAGEPKDSTPAVYVADGDEEHFSAIHRLEVELALDCFLPGAMRKRTTSPGGRLMDLRTAAAYPGCSYWTLRDLVLNGHIPAVRIPSPRARDGRVMRRILIGRAIWSG